MVSCVCAVFDNTSLSSVTIALPTLQARDPVLEALTDLDCGDLKVLFDNVTVIHKVCVCVCARVCTLIHA